MKKAPIIKITEVFKSKDECKTQDGFNAIVANILSECSSLTSKEKNK